MPQYYFSVDNEQPDRVGVSLPDLRAARSEAIRAAGESLRDIDGSLSGEWRMTVNDEEGHVVLELNFSAVDRSGS